MNFRASIAIFYGCTACMLDLVGNTIDRFSHEVSHIFFKYLIISFNSEISSFGLFMLNILFYNVTTLTKSWNFKMIFLKATKSQYIANHIVPLLFPYEKHWFSDD